MKEELAEYSHNSLDNNDTRTGKQYSIVLFVIKTTEQGKVIH